MWRTLSRASIVLTLLGACTSASAPVELVGRLDTYAVDGADGSFRYQYALELDSGEHVELVLAERPDVTPGERVALTGHFVSNERPLSTRDGLRTGETRFTVEKLARDPGAVGRISQALTNPPPVTVTAAVVLLNFNGITPQDYSADQARKDLQRVHDYYLEMSWGSWTMNSDLFGPYTVDAPSSCDLDTLANLAKDTARAQGVDIESYDHVGVKIPNIPGLDCPCGLAYVGTSPAEGNIINGGTSLYTCAGDNVFAHEMGHGIGLSHSSTAPCNGVAYRPGLEGCDIIEYGNRYNTMGGGLGHFNAMQKATLGWLNGCNITRVSSDGEFDLAPIQSPENDKTVQGLQIDTGDTSGGAPLYFYVEYRNPSLATFNALTDSGATRERGPGLHVTVSRDFRSTTGEGRTILIDASNGLKGLPKDGSDADQASGDPRMLEGETFKPTDDVTIQFVSRTETNAHVKVTFPGGGSGANQCQSSTVPTIPTVPSGYAAVLFQDCNYSGGWSAKLQEGKYTLAELQALGALDNDASSLLLAPGYDAILYTDDNFGGTSVTRHKSLTCFTAIDLNDALSSVEIVANGTALDAGASADAGVDAGEPGELDAGDGAPPGGGGVGGGGPQPAGCSCSLGAASAPPGWWVLFGLAALLVLGRRRSRT